MFCSHEPHQGKFTEITAHRLKIKKENKNKNKRDVRLGKL
jgi:hypothetical protein